MIYSLNYKNIHFLLSAPNINHMPIDNTIEIAFIGRSNSGKSSIINTLTNQKIAKISKTTGCTKFINIFEIPFKIRLIDFPGYGYANISKKKRKTWETNWNQYLQTRKNLKGIIFTTDIQHSINQTDKKIIQKINNSNILIVILLNKSDKLSTHTYYSQIKKIKKKIKPQKIQIFTFSSKSRKGTKRLQKTINHWYYYIKNNHSQNNNLKI